MLNYEKLQDLQAVENEMALREGREACSLSAENLGEGQGYWGYQQGKKIAINGEELSSDANRANFKEHMDTVLHEGRHSFQEQAAKNNNLKASPEEVKAWNSPIPDPKMDPKGYFNHPAEVDARAFAKNRNTQMAKERQLVKEYDAQHNRHINQILVTYDYVVLNKNNTKLLNKEGLKNNPKAEKNNNTLKISTLATEKSNTGKVAPNNGGKVKGQGINLSSSSGVKGGKGIAIGQSSSGLGGFSGGKGAASGPGGLGGGKGAATGPGASPGGGSGPGASPGGGLGGGTASGGIGSGPGGGPGIGGSGGPGIGA